MADGFSPPAAVRNNAKRALELRKKHNRGMTMVGVARARDLSNGKNISADTIRRMHSYFARHEVDKKGKDWANQSHPSAGYIAWLGWGGDAGRSWVNGIIKKLDAKESEEISEGMASHKAATVRGIFIRPGVSKNRRLYTRENIGKAIERMQSHISSGEGLPLTMATSHAAAFQDDALATVGRIISVRQLPDGSGMFEAEIANTSQGRDIAALAVGKFIKGVSIRGEWMGNLETVNGPDGQEATTAGDLRINGIDFTHSPGVEGAEIHYAELAESYTSSPYNIIESVEQVEVIDRNLSVVADETEDIIRTAIEDAVSSIMEKDSSKPYGDVSYADPGYQADKKKRYPIDTAKHVRAAWSYINQADNAKAYSAAQLRRIKSKIKSAAKKFGIDIQEEYQNLISDLQDVLEAYASTTIDNGAASVTVSGHAWPEELPAIAAKLAQAAIMGIAVVDPDQDGDIDAGTHIEPDSQVTHKDDMEGEGSMTDSPYMECHECGTECSEDALYCHKCGCDLSSKSMVGCESCGESSIPQDAMYCPNCGDPVPQAESTDEALTQTKENVNVDENITTAETSAEESGQAPVARTLTDADIMALAQIMKSVFMPSENAPEEEEAEVVADTPEVEAPEAPAEEVEVPAEEEAPSEATTPQENIVENNLFTAEQVAEMVQKAAAEAAAAAVEAATKQAVESYRTSGATRKGLSGANAAGSHSDDLAEGEFTAESLAEMNSQEFRQVQATAWGNTPFFAEKFARAERGF